MEYIFCCVFFPLTLAGLIGIFVAHLVLIPPLARLMARSKRAYRLGQVGLSLLSITVFVLIFGELLIEFFWVDRWWFRIDNQTLWFEFWTRTVLPPFLLENTCISGDMESCGIAQREIAGYGAWGRLGLVGYLSTIVLPSLVAAGTTWLFVHKISSDDRWLQKLLIPLFGVDELAEFDR